MNFSELLNTVAKLIQGQTIGEDHKTVKTEEARDEQSKQLLEELDCEDGVIDELWKYNAFDSQKAWQQFLHRNHIISHPRKISFHWIRWAAAVVLFFSVGSLLYWQHARSNTSPLSAMAPVEPGSQTAILHIDDQYSVNLSDSLTTNLEEKAQLLARIDQGQIAYNRTVLKPVQMSVQVPVKAEYHFSLPDGTKVWMNANSRVRFSHPFNKNERNVYAEGEVYFEVSKDADRPFIVELPNNNSIQVLGTQFNINTYNQAKEQKTVLIEGSILWKGNNGEQRLLKPSQLLTVNTLTQQIEVNDIDNIYPHIAWKDKRFVFERASLENIMQSLSLWYGVTFNYEDQEVKDLHFSIDIKRYENLNKILEMLELTNKIHFSFNESEIFIQKNH